jgi:hypothetical protein
MARARLLGTALLLVAAASVGAGCLDQVRDTVGAEPSHRWTTKATLEESVSSSGSLAAGEVPTAERETSFSVPFGSTDVRMAVDVEVADAGNVTVGLENPSETVYDRAFSSTDSDTFQTQEPETGEWQLSTTLRGDSAVSIRVDARVPVD